MKNYEILLIRHGDNITELIKQGLYPDVGRFYTFDPPAREGENRIEFVARCIKALDEIFLDMSSTGLARSAVITHIGVIMTLLGACGFPKGDPVDFMLQTGEGWLIKMSAYLWQKGNVFEIIGKLSL
jgi:broad specificity phosphatase PhoE